MTSERACNLLGVSLARRSWCAGMASAALLAIALHSNAQTPSASRPSAQAAAEQGVRWGDLKPPEQSVLQPLQSHWSTIDSPRKQKWLELAARFPKMSPTEQDRVQARMVEWAKLTPQERGQARVNFQEAKQLPPQDRQSRWDAYQKLPDEQKRELAARAAPPSPRASADASAKAAPAAPSARNERPGRELPQAKSNLVPNPASSAAPKPISPTIVQAGPGATTTMMTKRPNPPPHQQTGLPKIAATPEFVDKATLLPQRGPQGAAARSASANQPGSPKHP